MITEKYIVKQRRRDRVRKSIRKVVNGTPERPRMIIVRSNKFLYTQVVDDRNGNVLAAATTMEKELRSKLKSTKDKDAAKLMGQVIAQRLKAKKITNVVFDRGVCMYSGRVKVFADAARESGIQF
ncbi:MAG: 50S ribosomal protein L18 [Acidobacteriota bacterium]|jgi:large subunit ribosomal protein L18|nr:50S ribosomal protein L18 [Acidobacteriota bacterium]